MKREGAVTKEMSRQLNDDKKISRKEKDERILWKKNEVYIHHFPFHFCNRKFCNLYSMKPTTVLSGTSCREKSVLKCFLRVPQAVGLYFSCHAAQASKGNLQKTVYKIFFTTSHPRL